MKQFLSLFAALLLAFPLHAQTKLDDYYLEREVLSPKAKELALNTLKQAWGDTWLENQRTISTPSDKQQVSRALLILSRSSRRSYTEEELNKISHLMVNFIRQTSDSLAYADALLQRGRIVGLYLERIEEAQLLTEQALELTEDHYRRTPDNPLVQSIHLDVLSQMGKLLTHNEQPDAARPYLTRALKIAEHLGRDKAQVSLHNSIAYGYKKANQLQIGLEHQSKALQIVQSQGLSGLEADTLRNIGLTYKHLHDCPKAIDSINQAIALYQKANRPLKLAKALNYLGSIYNQQKDDQQAIAIYLDALKIYEEHDHHYGLGLISYNLSESFRATKDIQRAEEYNTRAIEEFTLISHKPYLLETHIQAIQLYTEQGNDSVALEHFYTVMEHLPDDSSFERIKSLRELSQSLLERAGDDQSFITLLQKELAAKESESAPSPITYDMIKSEHEKRNLQNELSKSQKKLKAIKNKAENYFSWISWVMAIALLLLITTGIQWYRLAKQRRLTAHLTAMLRVNRNTGLENDTDIQHKIHPVLIQKLKDWELWYADERQNIQSPQRQQFILIYCSFMDEIYEQHGLRLAGKLEKQFGQYVNEKFGDDQQIVQLRDNLLLVITAESDAESNAREILSQLHRFSTEKRILNRFAVGIMDFPFLPRSGKAMNEEGMSDVLLVALYAAKQLAKQFSESAWVYLKAIDATPASLLAQKPRKNLINGIEKGYIKVIASHDRREIFWQNESD